ncbi:MAG: hypothetical protein OXP08_05955 [bacterium]|nr:hypothetical protein [bacterium]
MDALLNPIYGLIKALMTLAAKVILLPARIAHALPLPSVVLKPMDALLGLLVTVVAAVPMPAALKAHMTELRAELDEITGGD